MAVDFRNRLFLFSVLVLVVAIVIFIAGLAVSSDKDDCKSSPSSGQTSGTQQPTTTNPTTAPEMTTTAPEMKKIKDLTEYCEESEEAKRIGLNKLLEKIKNAYFHHYPDKVAFQPGVTTDVLVEDLKTRYLPYNPHPAALKNKTDASLALLKEVNALKFDKNKLKPNEYRAYSEAKLMVATNFGTPFDEQYYNGDWMLGPNFFCWQPICSISYDINAIAFYWQPNSTETLEQIISIVTQHKDIVDQYIENMKLGVKAGMVRTKIDCKSGFDSVGESFKEISVSRDPRGVLNAWYSAGYLKPSFYKAISDSDNATWVAKKGKTPKESVEDALVEGLGAPIVKLLDYLEYNHSRHCLPDDFSTGLADLPIDYVYVDGKPDMSQKTTKVLPLTGEPLSGKSAYKNIMMYFLTTDISPEEVFKMGQSQLDSFYSQVKEIAKNVTGEKDVTQAITAFRVILDGDEQWHGELNFPANESDENAHKTCTSDETAAKYCPVRWKSLQIWNNYMREVMGMLYPKIQDPFYFTGDKNSVPNCPIEMLPHYNPSNGAFFFKTSDAACTTPAYYGMPFFLKKYGPKFQEWSVTGHEARPGHHTQVQGFREHFQNECGGIGKWFSDQGYYTVFTEGWGLYSENPVLSHDTDVYKDNIMQKYGMIKWQLWRAVRLIVDTGLHYRGMNRTWALKQFEDYAWDTTDFAVKEITRYTSVPAQALAYMIGRLELIKMRNKAKTELGEAFSLKDFHYQVLSQGKAPIDYLKNHIDRYIECSKNPFGTMCEYILTPKKAIPRGSSSSFLKQTHPQPPTRPHYHYV